MPLTCRDVAGLSSDYLSGELDWKTKLKIRFHLLLCYKCRRFVRHNEVVHQYVLKQQQVEELNEAELDEIMKKIKQKNDCSQDYPPGSHSQ